jgi:hypothetical protein
MKSVVFLFGLVIITSCTYNEISICDTDEPTYSDCVKPIIAANCLDCHSNGSAFGELLTYEELKWSIVDGDLIERIQMNENDAGFMPYGGEKLNELDIQILIKWKENGAKNN